MSDKQRRRERLQWEAMQAGREIQFPPPEQKRGSAKKGGSALTPEQRLARSEVALAEARAIFTWKYGVANVDSRADEIARQLKEVDAKSLLRMASRAKATAEYFAAVCGAWAHVVAQLLPEESRQMVSKMYADMQLLREKLAPYENAQTGEQAAKAREYQTAKAKKRHLVVKRHLVGIYKNPRYSAPGMSNRVVEELQRRMTIQDKSDPFSLPDRLYKESRLKELVSQFKAECVRQAEQRGGVTRLPMKELPPVTSL